MKKIKTIFLITFSLFFSLFAHAQEVEMADKMRSDGKIWVVVIVVLIILTGFIAYLISVDNRLKKLENK